MLLSIALIQPLLLAILRPILGAVIEGCIGYELDGLDAEGQAVVQAECAYKIEEGQEQV